MPTCSPTPPVIDPDAVAAAVSRLVGSPVRQVEPLVGSVGNQDFMVRMTDGDHVLKAGPAGLLRAEAWACARVRRLGVGAPEIIVIEPEPASLPMPFLLMRRLPGGPATESSPALAEAGAAVRAVHTIRLDGFGDLVVSDGGARGGRVSWARVVSAAASGVDELVAAGVLDPALAARAASVVATSEDLRYDGPPVLLHGDLKLLHLLADQDRLVGIIDWGDASAGDPRLDLARMSMAGPRAFAAFLSGYGLEPTPELERALRAYRLVWNLGALTYEHRAGGDWFEAYRREIQAAVDLLG